MRLRALSVLVAGLAVAAFSPSASAAPCGAGTVGVAAGGVHVCVPRDAADRVIYCVVFYDGELEGFARCLASAA